MAFAPPMKPCRPIALLALGAIFISSQANARLGEICLELPAGAQELKAQIGSGCLPTSPKYTDDFEVKVDGQNATISIDGSYKQVGDALIGTADCMGSRVIEETVEAAGPRRYSVVINGQYRGVLDASDRRDGAGAVKECFDSRSQLGRRALGAGKVYRRDQFSDWIARPKGQGKELRDPLYSREYATIPEAVAAAMGNHPESMDGMPSAAITISKAQWRGRPYQKPPAVRFMAVNIEEHGFLDDSVSGKRSFLDLRQNRETGMWRIGGHWHQFMCARGESAGQWSGKLCP